jgi:hypothetical protein
MTKNKLHFQKTKSEKVELQEAKAFLHLQEEKS